MHLEDHFSEEGLFGSRFFQVKVQGHGKVQSHESVNKLWEQNLCKFVVHLVTSNQRFSVSKEQKCSFYFWQLFI